MRLPSGVGSYHQSGPNSWRVRIKRGGNKNNKVKYVYASTEAEIIAKAEEWLNSDEGKEFMGTLPPAAGNPIPLEELLPILERTCERNGHDFKTVVQMLVQLGIMGD